MCPEQIEEYNDLLSNLKYAAIIQKGILPKDRHFKRLFRDYALIFYPKQMVSGDFYWIGAKENLKMIVLGDSTGHGLAAALISTLMINLIDYAFYSKNLENPADILKEIDKKFLECFSSEKENEPYNNDWVEMGVILINEKDKIISFSGTRKNLLIAHQNNLIEWKGKNFPIGGWQLDKVRKYETKMRQFSPGDRIFIYSDGIKDQIGGEKNKKFSSKRLKEIINQNLDKNLQEIKQVLEKEFQEWKGVEPQTDDVSFLAIELG